MSWTPLYWLLAAVLVLYCGALALLNCIPRVSVKSLGWLAIKNVTYTANGTTVKIGAIRLWLNLRLTADLPYRTLNISIHDVEVTKGKGEASKPREGKLRGLSLTLPHWLVHFLYRRRWMNQVTLHVMHCSVYHYRLKEGFSLHLDYLRLQSYFNKQEFSYSALVLFLDCFLKTKLDALHRIFRSLEVAARSQLIVSCPLTQKNKIKIDLSDVVVSLNIARLHVPKDLNILTEEERKEPHKKFSLRRYSEIIPVFSKLELNSLNSTFDVRDFRVQPSDFILSLSREQLYAKTSLKLSFNVTACNVFHLDLNFVEVPSFTSLLEIDLSEMLSVCNSESMCDEDYHVDITMFASLTNPTVNVYYDQMALVAELMRRKQERENNRNDEPSKPKSLHEIVDPYARVLKKIRRVSFKSTAVDLKVTLHFPDMDMKEFHRGSLRNITPSAQLSVLTFKSSTRNLSKVLHKTLSENALTLLLRSFLKLKNLRVDIVENEIVASKINILMGFCLNTRKVGIKIINSKFRVHSVNSMVFYVVRRLRENYISHYNEVCKDIVLDKPQKDTPDAIDLFSIVPEFVSSVKFRSASLLVVIICRDGLPSHTVFDEELQEDIDLGQFKRGVSLGINDTDFNFNRSSKIFSLNIGKIEAFTLSEYMAEYVDVKEKKDIVKSNLEHIEFDDVSSLESLASNDEVDPYSRINKVKRVLFAKSVCIENPENENLALYISAPEVDAKLDLFLVWCAFYARNSVKQFQPKVKQTYSKEQFKAARSTEKKLKLDIRVDSAVLAVTIPNDVDTLIELDLLSMANVLVKPICQVSYLRLYLVHPTTLLWVRLITITDCNFSELMHKSIDISSKLIRLNIPHKFLVYMIIDNVITFVKAFKQLKQNFHHLHHNINDYSRLMPEEKSATKFPNIHVTLKSFGLCLENDLFETELAMIYELGQVEQQARLKKEALFLSKAEELRERARLSPDELKEETVDKRRFLRTESKTDSNLDIRSDSRSENKSDVKSDTRSGSKTEIRSQSKSMKSSKNGRTVKSETTQRFKTKSNKDALKGTIRDPFNSKLGERKNDFYKSDSSKSDSYRKGGSGKRSDGDTESDSETFLSEEEAEQKIDKAREELDREIGTSWIQKYRVFRRVSFKSWAKRKVDLFGKDHINDTMKGKFSIQDFAPGAPLLSAIIDGFDLNLDKAKIDDVHEFLFKNGKGQPKLRYSILIPLWFDLRSDSVYVMLKDYVVPVLSFPSNSEQRKTMRFRGNLVINEKLVTQKEEMRHIFVPFSAAVKSKAAPDNFYLVYVPRTLTPVKMMFDLLCDLKTDRLCIVSWSKLYQAAISNATKALDNFTKPQIDDSPIGWWDKLSLILHGKLRFEVENELCFHLKSSTSPYKLVGKNAGLVFCFKNNVLLMINETGKRDELLMLNSDDFVLGIPNYLTTEKHVWSLFYPDYHKYLIDLESDSQKFQKRVMKFALDEKVRWKLGLLFERNKDRSAKELSSNQERISRFQPHWDVRITNPLYEHHEDLYEDYRAEYIHMAISVTSKSAKGNCYNAAYLSPLTFAYFFFWWNSINGLIGLPIREGKLFPGKVNTSKVKTGPHFFTIKYQLVLEPLTVSHIYTLYDDKDALHNVMCIGLKGKCKKCHIDLHQRREVLRYVNKNLGIDKKVRKFKLNSGEIDVEEADIRVVSATFKDPSIRGNLVPYYTGRTDNLLDVETYQAERLESSKSQQDRWVKDISPSSSDFSWLDYEDFIELEEREVLSADPEVDVTPFFYTPRFAYFRQFSIEVPEGRYPFGNEQSHRCLIGQVPGDISLQSYVREQRRKMAGMDGANNPRRLDEVPVGIDGTRDAVKEYRESLEHGYNRLYAQSQGKYTTRIVSENGSVNEFAISLEPSQEDNGEYKYEDPDFVPEEEEKEGLDFHNRFLIDQLRMKWNNDLRELVFKYFQLIGQRSAETLSMSRSALKLVESLVDKMDVENTSEPKYDYPSARDVLSDFEGYMIELDLDAHEIEPKFLIKFAWPQIQMICNRDPDSCIITSSVNLDMRIVGVNTAGAREIVSDTADETAVVETRFGVHFQDSHLFAFHRTEQPHELEGHWETQPGSWPPWVDSQRCGEVLWLKDNLMCERTSMALLRKKPNYLSIGDSSTEELIVHIAKIVFNATSTQYQSLFFVTTDLLLTTESLRSALYKRIGQVVSISDLKPEVVSEQVKMLQMSVRLSTRLLLKLQQQAVALSPSEMADRAHIEIEVERRKLELSIIIDMLKNARAVALGKRGAGKFTNVVIDQMIWHFLDENREPFVDLALASMRFSRLEHLDNSNSNTVEVRMMQGITLAQSTYPQLFRPLEASGGPLFKMSWSMMSPVGGIRIMRDAIIKLQPIVVEAEYATAKALHSYLFPKDDSLSSEEESLSDDESQSLKNLFKRMVQRENDNTDDSQTLDNDGILEILNRSGKYFVIDSVKVEKTVLVVSFRGPKHLNVVDVNKLKLTTPHLHFHNKTWLGADFAHQLRREVVKLMVAHTGRFIGNKFKIRPRKDIEPLQPIDDYSHYMTLDELQGRGPENRKLIKAVETKQRAPSRNSSLRPGSAQRS